MTTIAQAFNAITVAQGGTPKGGTIVDAIDALTDTLAGSDQPKPQTIADAVTLLGQHIGGGGGGTARVALIVWDTVEEETLVTGYGSFTADGVEIELTPFYTSEQTVAGLEGTVPTGSNILYTLPSGKAYDFDEDAPVLQFLTTDSTFDSATDVWGSIGYMQDPSIRPGFNAGTYPAMLIVNVKSA